MWLKSEPPCSAFTPPIIKILDFKIFFPRTTHHPIFVMRLNDAKLWPFFEPWIFGQAFSIVWSFWLHLMQCVASMFHEKMRCHIIMCSLNECSRTMDIHNSYGFEIFYLARKIEHNPPSKSHDLSPHVPGRRKLIFLFLHLNTLSSKVI